MIQADNGKSLLRELVGLTKRRIEAIGYQKLTVAGSVVSLTIPTNARYAEITVESSLGVNVAAIRHLELGTVTPPTTTDGIVKCHLNTFTIESAENLAKFRAIQAAVGTHTLHIQYFK